jgi:hypothetical protein
MTRDDTDPGDEQNGQAPAPAGESLDHEQHDHDHENHHEERGGTAMNHEAFDRLRAADPAHDAPEPAAGVLRAKVDALIGEGAPAAGAPATAAPSGPAPDGSGTDELARRRSWRRPQWLVAAAVAGFVAVGGGGYAAGSSGLLAGGAGAADTSSAAAPPIMLDGPGDAARDAADGAESEAMGDIAPQSQEEIGREPAVGTLLYPAPSHTVFHVGAGLSDAAGELAAYTLDARSAYSKETAEKAARALGLRGEARQEDGAWVVGPNDGTAGNLTVAADGQTSIWFNDVWPDSWRCDVVEPYIPDDAAVDDGSAAAGEGSSGGAPDSKGGDVPPCPEDGAGAPSEAAATDELRRLMRALDADVAAFDFEAHATGMGTTISAYHRIDGRQTGLSWSVTMSGTGSDVTVVSLNGFLAPVTELGVYPVVSEREAVARLGDARFGATPGYARNPAAETWAESWAGDAEDVMPDQPPAALEPGARIAWPVRDVTITSAQLGVAQHTLTDGAVVLIPAYEMTGTGGNWSVIAVADDLLDFAGR